MNDTDIKALVIAFVVGIFAVGIFGYALGMSASAHVTTQAHGNAIYARDLLLQCLDATERAMDVVEETDLELWTRLDDMPRWADH